MFHLMIKASVVFFSFYYYAGNMQREDEGGGGRKVKLRVSKIKAYSWQLCHFICGMNVSSWSGTGKKWRYSTTTEITLEMNMGKWLKFDEYNHKKSAKAIEYQAESMFELTFSVSNQSHIDLQDFFHLCNLWHSCQKST